VRGARLRCRTASPFGSARACRSRASPAFAIAEPYQGRPTALALFADGATLAIAFEMLRRDGRPRLCEDDVP
jgi:hypothetical protein